MSRIVGLTFLLVLSIVSCKKEDFSSSNHPVGRLHYALNSIKKKKTFNIVVIGGSITEGAGASEYGKAWSPRLKYKLEDELNRDFKVYNYGIGASTSTLGMYRIRRALAAKPDLVIIEFAVNDNSIDSLSTIYNHENIFKQLYDCKIPYLSLNLNTENGGTAFQAIKRVVDNQKAPCVRVQLNVGDYLDGTHPNDQGHKKIANQIADYLIKVKSDYKDEPYIFPSSLVKYDFTKADLFSPDLTSVAWVQSESTYTLDRLYKSNKASDTLEFEFSGNRIGLVSRWSKTKPDKNSKFLVQVDGGLWKELRYNYSSYQAISSDILAEDLSEGKHSLKLITSPILDGEPVEHEIIDFMISGKEELGIRVLPKNKLNI